ncbi:MAG: MobC family plasmid mobilization relaxosome protein [Cyanobacteriota bacterium]|nr:MobC family plasmid mobilization relaxosome protein [Cyanobacteriota bacterium]
MASSEGMSVSSLMRSKTLYRRLPRRVTDVARGTYLELGKIGVNINQLVKALNTANQLGTIPSLGFIRELQKTLPQLQETLNQIRREMTELDLLAALEEIQEEQEIDSSSDC